MYAAASSRNDLTAVITRWATLWGVPGISRRIEVIFSDRLRRSLGRCVPAKGIVRLNARLQLVPALLVEVLCHEVAHVAAYELHGQRCRPHGREWKALMRTAGFEPSVRARPTDIAPAPRPPSHRALTFEHRCPVCQAVRLARRPVPQWRCAVCVRDGLDGRLLILKHGGAADG
jgi:predicted SprT family Zn-dependent metalloprotease